MEEKDNKTRGEDVLIKPKAKTAKGKRVLKARDPQFHEGPKQAVFVKGTTTSNIGNQCLQSLYALKKQHSVILQKRNDLHPFEFGKNEQAMEFLMQRNECSLMCLHTHSKKRSNNLTFVRTYDHHLYDMYELQVVKFCGMKEVCERTHDAWTSGEKPAMVFSGEAFAMDDRLGQLKLFLLDFFRGVQVNSLDITGFHTVMYFVMAEDGRTLLLRVYHIKILDNKKFELSPLGPFIDFTIGRMKLADEDVRKHAHRQPKALNKPAKAKNVTSNVVGQKFGRVHVGRQDIGKLQTRKVKALKKQPKEKVESQ